MPRQAPSFLSDYNTFYYTVANSTPPPFSATATNNSPVQIALGNNHPGGNICGSASGAPCNDIPGWFAIEFP